MLSSIRERQLIISYTLRHQHQIPSLRVCLSLSSETYIQRHLIAPILTTAHYVAGPNLIPQYTTDSRLMYSGTDSLLSMAEAMHYTMACAISTRVA